MVFEQLKIYYEAQKLKLNDNFATNLELIDNYGAFNYVAYLLADTNNTSIKVAKYKGNNRVDLIENNEYGYCSLIKSTKQVLEKITSAGNLPDHISQNEFFEGISIPRNKELMRIFKDLDLVEQLGSGIPRILENYGHESVY